MTEAQWLACEDPRKLVAWARPTASDRKLRLFACAFWRWHKEQMARRTGEVGPEMGRALDYAERWAESGEPPRGPGPMFSIALKWHPLFARAAFRAASWTIRGSPTCGRAWIGPEEEARQVLLLGDIFGGRFPPACVDPAWLTLAVASLAAVAYEERALPSGELDPQRLAVLADALEDAGCTNADLLGHLRSPGPHVRGCWAIDLVLGKG